MLYAGKKEKKNIPPPPPPPPLQVKWSVPNLKFLDNKSKFVWLLSADDHYIHNQLYALLKKNI